MPKTIFYAGTAFCLFIAVMCAGEAARGMQSGQVAFVALQSPPLAVTPRAVPAIVVAVLSGFGVAAMLLRMAALVAPRNLFGAFAALLAVGGAVASFTGLLLLQARIVMLIRSGADPAMLRLLAEGHLIVYLMLGSFAALSVLTLRSYFRVQASRFLSAIVVLPLPLYVVVLAQEIFVRGATAPFPLSSTALRVFLAVLAVVFFSIAVHCVRHRHLFIEMTNLRELLDSRIDPAAGSTRPIRLGGAAFDS